MDVISHEIDFCKQNSKNWIVYQFGHTYFHLHIYIHIYLYVIYIYRHVCVCVVCVLWMNDTEDLLQSQTAPLLVRKNSARDQLCFILFCLFRFVF